jgi:hypothetical protein
MDLVTLAAIKAYLLPGETQTLWDTILAPIISAVSELIEREIGDRLDLAFYTAKAGLSFVVDATNNKINFDEGGAELTGTVTAGTYTGATLATAIAAALNTAPGKALIYTCTYSSTAGKFTIAAGSNFTLRWNTGTNKATDISELCGFEDAANSTGDKTYTSLRVAEEARASGSGGSLLHLPNWPIKAVFSVFDKSGTEYIEGDDEDFVITPRPSAFSLMRNASTWELGFGNFTVKYEAGYETIPADIVLVAYELIARKWKTMNEKGWGESARTMTNGSVTSVNAEGEINKAQAAVLHKYKRWTA